MVALIPRFLYGGFKNFHVLHKNVSNEKWDKYNISLIPYKISFAVIEVCMTNNFLF